MPLRLRIIIDADHSPAFNMAADRYLLQRCASPEGVIVRFYQWEPPAVSLGCMQDAAQTLDEDAMRRDGIAWVNRPTGGRAVLHQDDLTYACAFPRVAQGMGATIAQSYGTVAAALVAGLRRAGIDAVTSDSRLDSRQVRSEVKLPCFLAPNRDEIMVAGKKLVGSAQKRTDRAVVQHGSIPLGPAFRNLPRYLAVSTREREVWGRLLNEKSGCIREIMPTLTVEDLTHSLVRGFEGIIGSPATVEPWSDGEVRQIAGMETAA